jgi:DNA-binding response OmpR family regulator
MGQANDNAETILIVEDEPVISEMCRRVLSDEGFRVTLASNGKAAMSALEEREYDLCLIDIRTPEMNGIELYGHLEKKYPEIVSRVVFTTGDVINGNIKTFLDKTNRPYLTKPFTPDVLKAIVRNTLARNG